MGRTNSHGRMMVVKGKEGSTESGLGADEMGAAASPFISLWTLYPIHETSRVWVHFKFRASRSRVVEFGSGQFETTSEEGQVGRAASTACVGPRLNSVSSVTPTELTSPFMQIKFR